MTRVSKKSGWQSQSRQSLVLDPHLFYVCRKCTSFKLIMYFLYFMSLILDMLLINLVFPRRSQTTLMSLSSENAYVYIFFFKQVFWGNWGTVVCWTCSSKCTQRRGDTDIDTDGAGIPMGAMKSKEACDLKISTHGIFTFPSVCCLIPPLSPSLCHLPVPPSASALAGADALTF